jgi:glutamine amidotransferase
MADSWVTVPTNSILTIHGQTVLIHPILDEFYSADPLNSRSLTFAQTKGQTVTNTKKDVLNISKISSKLGNINIDSSSSESVKSGLQDATTP